MGVGWRIYAPPNADGLASRFAGLWVVRTSITASLDPGAHDHVVTYHRNRAEIQARRNQAAFGRGKSAIAAKVQTCAGNCQRTTKNRRAAG